MKILHYERCLRLELGGVVRAVLDFCQGQAEAGEDVTLAAADATDAPEAWKRGDPGCPTVVEVPTRRVGGLYHGAGKEQMKALVADCDVLHLHSMWGLYNNQLARIARSLDTPYIASIHGMLDDWCMAQKGLKKRLFLALGGRAYLEGAHAVHCTAKAELDQSRTWFPGGHGVVIPLIFDLSEFSSLPGPEAAHRAIPVTAGETPILLFLSRLHYKKGVDLLIKAAELLEQRGITCHVIIAGTGDEVYTRKLEALVAQRRLENLVSFTGFISGIEKISLYQAADLFVLPTSQENFGFVLFEALAAGTPVLTTRGADTWPEMEASGGAIIVEPDASALADAAATLLADPDRRAEMGRNGRDWVLQNLDNTAITKSFQDLYAEAAGS